MTNITKDRKLNYAAAERLKFILDHVKKHGWVGREPLISKFGITKPTASADFRRFHEMHPGFLSYDSSSKRYVRGEKL